MKRHSLFHLWFAILVILSTSVCLASESYDNLHIYYTGNRITGVLEDAATVTTNGSMDYVGTTGRKREVEYNEWGAMTKDYLGNNRAVVNGSTGENNYDGYRFAENGSDIYNPWSLLNALSFSKISNYWNDTGMPRLVAKTLKRVNADLEKMFDTYCTQDDLKGLDLLTPQPLALLYQTGYLTIKSYNSKLKRYRLGIPNREVKDGLYKILLPYYVQSRSDDEPKRLVGVNFSSETRCIEDWKIERR